MVDKDSKVGPQDTNQDSNDEAVSLVDGLFTAASRGEKANLPALQFAPELGEDYRPRVLDDASLRAYRADFLVFARWCLSQKARAMPASPERVAGFISHEATRGIKATTLVRRLAAIRFAHSIAGYESPTSAEIVRGVMRGIKERYRDVRKTKTPLTSEILQAFLRAMPNNFNGKRDRALLLTGFAGALRRAELAALNVDDIAFNEEGALLRIIKNKNKTNETVNYLPIVRGMVNCPVEALQNWMKTAALMSGPVFRAISKGGIIADRALTPHAIALIIKKWAKRAGFDHNDFAGHSLRSGFLTSAAERGASIWKLMEVSRHRRMDSVRDYVRRRDLFKDHAGEGLL